jgi:GntR family histidine utilization transcriptional repressor
VSDDFHGGVMDISVRTNFRAVKQEIIKRIQTRMWLRGQAIPGEEELAVEFGCARATVNRAMRDLVDEGLIERKRKSGSRVALAPVRHARLAIPLIRTEIEAGGATYRYALVDRAIAKSPDWLKARFNFPAEGDVLHLRCMHFGNSSPHVFEDRWISISAVPEVRDVDFAHVGPNEWLIKAVPFTTAEFHFSAALATPDLAQFLAVNLGDALFVAERCTWLNDLPVTYARLSHRAGYRMTTVVE